MNRTEIAALLKDYSDSPELDALFFIEENPDENTLKEWIARRQKYEPVAKIIGKKGFWKWDFRVSTETLDPRPDSETMIESVLKMYPQKDAPLRFLDLGTGSGCLLICLLKEYAAAAGVGLDSSLGALAVATQNAIQHQVSDRTHFLNRSWFDDSWMQDLKKFDVIISNPPYIPTAQCATLDEDVRLYDPMCALDGGADGLRDYRRLAQTIRLLMKKDTRVFFEIGKGQENDVITLMQSQGFTFFKSFKDLAGIVRILCFL